jgi:hypothetical protein
MLAFFNLSQDGSMYDVHASLEPAEAILREHPDDSITVLLLTPPCLRYLTDPDYPIEDAMTEGMLVAEYVRVDGLDDDEELTVMTSITRGDEVALDAASLVAQHEDRLKNGDPSVTPMERRLGFALHEVLRRLPGEG